MAEFGSQQEKIERDYDVRVRKYLRDVNEGKLSLDNVPTTYRQDVESRFRAMTPGYMSPSEVRRLDIQGKIAAERQQLKGGTTFSNTKQLDPEAKKLAEIYSKRIIDGQMDFEKVPKNLQPLVESQVKEFSNKNENYVSTSQQQQPPQNQRQNSAGGVPVIRRPNEQSRVTSTPAAGSAMSALNQPEVVPAQGNSLSESPNQEAEINATPAAVTPPAPAAPSGTTIAAAAGAVAGLATSFLFGGKSASSETTENASGMVSKFTGGFGNFFSNRGGGGGARNNQSVGGKIQPITGKGSGVGALQHYEPMLNALNKIYTFLRRNVESDRKNRELENNYREELALEEERRHKELLKALKILMSNIFSRSGTQTTLSNEGNRKSKGLLGGLLGAGVQAAGKAATKVLAKGVIKGAVKAFFAKKSLKMAGKAVPLAILAGAGVAAYKWANGDLGSAIKEFGTWLPFGIGTAVEISQLPKQLDSIAEEIYKEQYGDDVVPDDVKKARMAEIKQEIADEIKTLNPLPEKESNEIWESIKSVGEVVDTGVNAVVEGVKGNSAPATKVIGNILNQGVSAAQQGVAQGVNKVMEMVDPERARLNAPIDAEPSTPDASQRVLDMYKGPSQQPPAPKPGKTSSLGIGPMLSARNTENSYVRSIYTSTYVV